MYVMTSLPSVGFFKIQKRTETIKINIIPLIIPRKYPFEPAFFEDNIPVKKALKKRIILNATGIISSFIVKK